MQLAGNVSAVFEAVEQLLDLGMAHGSAGFIDHQILLGDVGDVSSLFVLRQQMIEGLVLAWTDGFGNRLPPLLGIREGWVDIEDHTAERKQAVPHDLPALELDRKSTRMNSSH